MTEGEKNIISVVNDGLKSGAIAIPGSGGKRFPAIHSVSQYLKTFSILIAERIKNQFQPLFDPAAEMLSPEILAVNKYIREKAGYSLYDAQLAVCEAHKRCLEQKKATLCIAECGSGKTKIGITVLHACQQRNVLDGKNIKHFNIVLCPSHRTKKWVREIEESLPDTFAAVITGITELRKVYEAYMEEREALKNWNGSVITTHRYLLNMDEKRLREYDAVIIDEDIIFKSVLPNQGEITVSKLEKLLKETTDRRLAKKIKRLYLIYRRSAGQNSFMSAGNQRKQT